ncbi:MAG: DUF1295 domain-containing protein [Cellvibrionaceae bacterium]
MKKILSLAPYFFGWALLLLTSSLFEVSLVNGFLQLLLFTLVVCIPAWRTGRMSYVDIGWPWGLLVIGVVTLVMADGHWLRVALVSGVYIFMGGRMGWAAIKLWRAGHLKSELPRYKYQYRRWQHAGIKDHRLVMQVEVLAQGLANASFLAFPALIIAANPSAEISVFEVLGLALWVLAFTIESVADVQKDRFIRDMNAAGEKNRVCNLGLWRYSRHPNYFAEWMVWNALIVAALPSLWALSAQQPLWLCVLLALGLVFVSRMMYVTLVYYTGAKPAEFYSVQKRPEYKDYQQTTNRFFLGPSKAES